jgi:hypothetical protein
MRISTENPVTDAELARQVIGLLRSRDRDGTPRVMAPTLIGRQLFGRRPDASQQRRLERILQGLTAQGAIWRYPDIGVAEPPYLALEPESASPSSSHNNGERDP